MKKLRKLGVSIALDDFGRASASLASLRAYPFDEVKIDRVLIEEAPTHEDSAAIVQSVALLAQALSMRSTAEGVETLDELSLAMRAGCKKVQGFCFGRPVPAAELAALLAECPQKLAHAA